MKTTTRSMVTHELTVDLDIEDIEQAIYTYVTGVAKHANRDLENFDCSVQFDDRSATVVYTKVEKRDGAPVNTCRLAPGGKQQC